MAAIILSKDEGIKGWSGTLGDKPLYFPDSTAGNAYHFLKANYPNVRVGFNAEDMGPACVALYGKVIWMKKDGDDNAGA